MTSLMVSLSVSLVVSLVASPVASAASDAQAAAPCKLQQMAIPVQLMGQRPVASLSLNGQPVQMLVDSGAFFSLLTRSTATQLKLPIQRPPPGLEVLGGHTGEFKVGLVRVDKVGLAGAELPNVDFLVGGTELGLGIGGLLGQNVLAAADVEYDLAHGWVKLSFPTGDCQAVNFAHWAGQAPVVVVPLAEELEGPDLHVVVDMKINGERMRAMLDTGAPLTVMSLEAARVAGIARSQFTAAGTSGGASADTVRSWTAPVASIEIGGEKVSNIRLRVDEIDRGRHDLLLGLDYFLSHRLYISRLQKRIYITWNGTPVFPADRHDASALDPQYAALPTEVADDDADGLARRGAAALAAGKLPEARRDLDRAVALAPKVADYRHLRARLHRQAGTGPQLALADLDEALRLDAELSEARWLRASLRSELDEDAAALADLRVLDASLPPSAHLRLRVAGLLGATGQVADALRNFDLWMTNHADDAQMGRAHSDRCWLRTRLNMDLPLALRDCERAVELDPHSGLVHGRLGWTHLRMGEASEALEAFDAAIAHKRSAWTLYGRGLVRRRLNDPVSGQRDLAEARQLAPTVEAWARKAGLPVAAEPSVTAPR